MTITLWQDASAFSTRAHRHQARNDGTPYASHPARVAMTIAVVFSFDDPEILAAAFLHDTIEDCDVDYDDLLELFGRNVADYVAAMSKDMRLEEPMREVAYDKQLADGPWQGRLIKLADVYDNYTDQPANKRATFVDKVQRILAITKNDEQLCDASEILRTLVGEAALC